jgi:hypothetical protein
MPGSSLARGDRRGISCHSSQTSRSSEKSRFPYVLHWLIVSCKFRSICFAKLVRQI